jgi:arginine N-succinyltransferase
MFYLREAYPQDLPALMELAEHLDTVNLPHDEQVLSRLLHLSDRSFGGDLADIWKREYLFVLIDTGEDEPAKGGVGEDLAPGRGRVIGTSMIIAQHGTRNAPHIYFELMTDERYSQSLDRHIQHKVLKLGFNYSGPTEIGGLILLPDYRRHPDRLGRSISFVRFLYMAMHRPDFRETVLSELLPPLEADGSSLLWEQVGRRFTQMSYQEADFLSKENKEFIHALFPETDIYATLLTEPVQAILGQVGPQTRGVEKMLREIGFEFAGRIDPFDGGPHFVADTRDIRLVKEARRALVAKSSALGKRTVRALVGVERRSRPRFVAVATPVRLEEDEVLMPAITRRALGVKTGDPVWLTPIP